ncbi:MAG: PaeR7I family type II restriction endonuclease [Bdellovibrionales bacterium]|nr:PaeR7I family type II restriction endonuclease [Bdellovibrionales bacterium]
MSSKSRTENIVAATSNAVAWYWTTRKAQQNKQHSSGRADQGARSAVTGGAQMNGFIRLFSDAITGAGMDPQHIYLRTSLELPGFFRPTKGWDLLVVKEEKLLVALEAKSQVGPSFGNNFNNRTEEAMGSALDLWTAFREGAFLESVQPFLGYFFMLEDCPASQSIVRIKEPHFEVFPEFKNASYAKRYELFCRKLVRERHYTSSAFITSQSDTGLEGKYREPASDLSIVSFVRTLAAHISANV